MTKKIYLFVLSLCSLFLVPDQAQAQGRVGITKKTQGEWRIGINGGATWNHYSIDKKYQTDYRYPSQWGGTAGVYTQYNFFDWLGLRAGAYFAQRNYRQTRTMYADMNVRYENNYLLFPVTANFSFGGQQVRGFVNAGVYGGAWLNCRRFGSDYVSVGPGWKGEFDEQLPLNAQKDQRGDFGVTGGVGIEYRFHAHWMVQIEATCYYSVISATKQYMEHVKDYRYHTTIGLQAGIAYIF